MVTTIKSRIPNSAKTFTFARHETFHLRDGWLYKGMEAVKSDPELLYSKVAHHDLGLGINMMRSMRYWLQATGLVELGPKVTGIRPPYQLSELGKVIYEQDPYFEDIGTLWLIHIELVTSPRLATFWYWAFNEFSQREFSEDRLVEGIKQYCLDNEHSHIAESSIQKDARCFLRSYLPSVRPDTRALWDDRLDCPLASLDLLRRGTFPGQYRFHVGRPHSLSTKIFEYQLFKFREVAQPDQEVVSLEDLRWASMGPGRVLGLDMATILEFVETLELKGSSVRLVRTAGLNLVTLNASRKSSELLREYYAGDLTRNA